MIIPEDPYSPDPHATNSGLWYGDMDPNNGQWIQYQFDKLYKLHEMFVWNYNKFEFEIGFKKVRIEYSEDANSWTEITDVNEFSQATGKTTYTYGKCCSLWWCHSQICPYYGINQL